MTRRIFVGFESGLVERHPGAIWGDFFEMNNDLGRGKWVDRLVPKLAHDDEARFIENEELSSFFKNLGVIECVPSVIFSADLGIEFEKFEFVALG